MFEPRIRSGVEGGPRTFPDRFKRRADVQYFMLVRGREPKDGIDMFGELTEPLLTFSEIGLDPFPSRDVADHPGILARAPHLHFTDRQMNVDTETVFSFSYDFPAYVDDGPSADDQMVGEVLVVVPAVRRRHDHADVLSDQLLFFVSQESDQGGIDLFDLAILFCLDGISSCFRRSRGS